MKKLIYSLVLLVSQINGHLPTQEETIKYKELLESQVVGNEPDVKCISIPEGGFVYCSHPTVEDWLNKPLNGTALKEIEETLKDSLDIPFNKQGFTQAVPKEEGDTFGEVSYSAIWVRDCCWHYYGLKINQPENAAKLLLSLLKFYSSEDQLNRFISVIKNPSLADPNVTEDAHMRVPLIRFSSKTLSHHQVNGKDQEWNHLQFDSHGLFLLALSDAIRSGILKPSALTPENFEILALFPAFFSQTNYATKKDAGPWEEELFYNASSAGLVASGLKTITQTIAANAELTEGMKKGFSNLSKKISKETFKIIVAAASEKNIQRLYSQGMARVNRNLSLGGESPDLTGKEIDKKADAALLFLALVENTPFFNDPKNIKEILNITSSLVGPFGVYRYKNDPYQAVNYWTNFDIPSAISGSTTPALDKLAALKKGYMPHNQSCDAQWFFDSCIADLYYHLSMFQREKDVRQYYVRQGDIHLKRSLGQLTGFNSFAGNGERLEAFQLPESINTIIDPNYGIRPLPSPICPLSWSKAALQMALTRGQAAHSELQ